MTTNKPEVVAWLRNERGEHARGPATFDPMCIFGSPEPQGLVASYSPVVMLSDYEALQAECEKLRAAIRRLCDIYVVDDYYDGQLREERLDRAVNRAINDAMQETNP